MRVGTLPGVLALALTCVCATGTAAARVIVVSPVDQPDLQAAIESASDGDVITFPAGGGTIALSGTVDVGKGVDIEGCSDPNAVGPCVTLQASSGFDGLDVTAGAATIRGLSVSGAAVGIHVTGGSGTLIGGPLPGQETTISDSEGSAIQVDGPATGVTVDRITGLGNGGPFISLVAGANGAPQPPTVLSASSAAVAGLAPPGTLVRLYDAPDAGSVSGFAGEATADGTGIWELPGAVAGETVAATETGASGTSQMTAPVVTAPGALPAPTTTIAGPSEGATVTTATPSFRLSAPDPSATFVCRIDGATYTACAGVYQPAPLSPGQHTLYVRAAGAGGLGPEASTSFAVDLIAPATIASGPPRFGHKSSAVFRFTVPSGTRTTQCAIDDGRYRTCASTFATGYLLDGRHVFRLRTTDASGRAAVLDSVFTIDTLPPLISLATAVTRIGTGDTPVTIRCPASEPGGCTGTVRLGTRPKRKSQRYREIGSASWQAGPSTSVTVLIPVPAWATTAAQRGKGLLTNVVVVAQDDAGNVRQLRRKGRLLPALPPTGGGGVTAQLARA